MRPYNLEIIVPTTKDLEIDFSFITSNHYVRVSWNSNLFVTKNLPIENFKTANDEIFEF